MGKKPSKRTTLKKKYKIERKVRQHNKKLRQDLKKTKGKRKKDPGVPNSVPFKEEILKQVYDLKLKKKAEEEERRLEQQRIRKEKKSLEKSSDLAEYVSNANLKTTAHEIQEESMDTTDENLCNVEFSKKMYYREFRKVVEQSDVLIEVLDARDPLGCRCKELEETVLASPSKKLILLLNKIDLVPLSNVRSWLAYLRKEFPTIAFRSSTQDQRRNLSMKKVKLNKLDNLTKMGSCCLGSDRLMKLISNYSRSDDVKLSIVVGVIGYPNVGKSSVINSLKRSKACNVGAVPGVTKCSQEIHLDKNIRLLDSPGIVLASNQSPAQLILRNCVSLENLEDPLPAVELILSRCRKDQILMKYKIPDYSSPDDFCAELALKRGILKKGGVPSIEKAARTFIKDWIWGNITYYTQPPLNPIVENDAKIVSDWGKSFDIDAILAEEDREFSNMDTGNADKGLLVESLGVPTAAKEDDIEAMAQEEFIVENSVKEDPKPKKSRPKPVDPLFEIPGNQKYNKVMKNKLKKMKKQQRRSGKIAADLSDALSSKMDLDSSLYSFNDNFSQLNT